MEIWKGEGFVDCGWLGCTPLLLARVCCERSIGGNKEMRLWFWEQMSNFKERESLRELFWAAGGIGTQRGKGRSLRERK